MMPIDIVLSKLNNDEISFFVLVVLVLEWFWYINKEAS
jgi:hypothetical protein